MRDRHAEDDLRPVERLRLYGQPPADGPRAITHSVQAEASALVRLIEALAVVRDHQPELVRVGPKSDADNRRVGMFANVVQCLATYAQDLGLHSVGQAPGIVVHRELDLETEVLGKIFGHRSKLRRQRRALRGLQGGYRLPRL